MKIRVMTVCKNEERIMPFFIKHYEPWVDEILIIDGGSTDNSLNIAKQLGNGKVISRRAPYDDGKYIDDDILNKIRNEEWKDGRENFDWMIVCDNDELLYHSDIVAKLTEYKDKGITLPKIDGYQMISKVFPNINGKITDQIKTGTYTKAYSKQILFDCTKITSINYSFGSHFCYPIGEVVYSDNAEFKLLHYRMLSYEYHMHKAKLTYDNLARHTELFKTHNFGHHNGEILEKCTPEVYDKEYTAAQFVI